MQHGDWLRLQRVRDALPNRNVTLWIRRVSPNRVAVIHPNDAVIWPVRTDLITLRSRDGYHISGDITVSF